MKKETIEPDILASLQEIISPEYLSESSILNLLPAAVCLCDMTGVIKKYNEQAVKLWGRRPVPGDKDEKFCGSFRLYLTDGSPLPHDQTPVASCLADGKTYSDLEVIIERPDNSRIHVRINIIPVMNAENRQIGVLNCFYDITSQVEAKQQLNRKTKELEDYVENAPVGLHWLDAEGNIKWANQTEMHRLGYGEEEFIGRNISDFHVYRSEILKVLNRLNQEDSIGPMEMELRCKNGTVKTLEVQFNIHRENGKYVHTRCFTTDISEQKKLVRQIISNEESHRRILKNLPAAIYSCDKDGFITFYNDEAVKLWGYEPETGKSKWCESWKISYPNGEPMPLDQCPMARCLKEGIPVTGEEIIITRPDGEKKFVLPYPEPLFDKEGRLTGAVNMLVDITEEKKAEQVLRESEQRYRTLAESMEKIAEEKTANLKLKHDELKKSEERYHKMIEEVEDYAIILLDENGYIRNWNKGAEKIKGYKESEIIGKNFQVFYLPHDRESGLPFRLINLAREKGKAIHEGWRMRKDGSRFWGSIVLTALHNEKQEVIGFSKVTRDLTERKISEDKLREYAAQLKFQNEQLEQFAYAASHDMKEPLRKILFYTNHLIETIADSLQEKEKEYITRSLNAAKRMERLINDLLEYSKAASVTQGFEPVDLNEILDETLITYRETIEQKRALISNADLPTIVGIPFQVRQVFDNLLSNALKYQNPSRPPRISIQAEKVKGEGVQELEPDKWYHKITVTDNGIGFEPEYADKIFELFQRLGGLKYSGTGVGLALCKRIAQNHHGTILAEGEPDQGARFSLYFPA